LKGSDINMGVEEAAVQNLTTPPPLLGLFSSFLRLGVTAFGGPAMVAYIRQMAVDKRRWLDADAFDGGVALCQAIPGATAMQTAAYVGLRVRGVAGAAASFVGFGLPAFGLMLALSALYARTHDVPVIVSAFSGLRAIIVALVANATVSFGKTSLKRWPHVFMAALAAALFAWQASPFLVIVLAGLLAALFIPASPAKPSIPLAHPDTPHTAKTVVVILGATALAFLGLWIVQRRLFDLAALMFRIDLFAFGGGFSSVPLMFHETVEVRRWLDGTTLLNGIVLGQVTPGPIVITATFIGYLLAGLAGGVTATVSVFLPSFLILVATAPHFDRLRTSPRFNKIISGVLCSFVGLLLTVSARFAQGVTWDWLHLVLAVGAFAALRLKANVLWIVLIGAVLSIALCR
jgi:chromate transporter